MSAARRRHVLDCVWLFWPVTLLTLIGVAVIVFSLTWHPEVVMPHTVLQHPVLHYWPPEAL